jgi:hypothetical protein
LLNQHPLKRCAEGELAAPQVLLIGQRFYAWELLAFKELEARAAARANVCDLVGEAGLVDGRN